MKLGSVLLVLFICNRVILYVFPTLNPSQVGQSTRTFLPLNLLSGSLQDGYAYLRQSQTLPSNNRAHTYPSSVGMLNLSLYMSTDQLGSFDFIFDSYSSMIFVYQQSKFRYSDSNTAKLVLFHPPVGYNLLKYEANLDSGHIGGNFDFL